MEGLSISRWCVVRFLVCRLLSGRIAGRLDCTGARRTCGSRHRNGSALARDAGNHGGVRSENRENGATRLVDARTDVDGDDRLFRVWVLPPRYGDSLGKAAGRLQHIRWPHLGHGPVDDSVRTSNPSQRSAGKGSIYPAVGFPLGHRYPSWPTFGVPCPTTILPSECCIGPTAPCRSISC